MTTEELITLHESVCYAARGLMAHKNHDYAYGDPFRNFRGAVSFGVDPITGILLRMSDKMHRIQTFVQQGELHVKNESVDDSIVDIVNYAVLIAGMIGERK